MHSPLSAHALASALTGSVSSDRPYAKLRTILAQEYQAEGVVLTDSGTSALGLAIQWALADADPPGIVALPAFSCYDIATAAVGADARVVLYDLDPETLAPDMQSLEAALHSGARAVVVAPLYGVPVEWESVASLAATHGAVLIEDAAQGHGAKWQGRPLGALGDVSVLSFGRGKGWTGGGGGALLWRGSAPALELRLQDAPWFSGPRALAGALAQWILGRPAMYRLPTALPWLGLGETRYHDPEEPRGLSRVTASLAVATRGAAQSEARLRRQRARELLDRLPAAVGTIRVPVGGEAGYLRLPVLVENAGEVISDLRALGVACAYPDTLSRLPSLRGRLIESRTGFPGAARLVHNLLTLPTHGLLQPWERDRIVNRLRRLPGRS